VTPLPDGRCLLLGPDLDASVASIRAFSPRDAARWPLWEGFVDRLARAVEPLLDRAPPDPRRPRARDLATLWRVGRGVWSARRELPDAAALLLGSARDALVRWFESEPLRGTLATDAVIGAWAAPSTPGTGYVLLHHVMGETGGARGVWAYVEGGMGRLADSVAEAARRAGATIRVDAPVRRVLLAGHRAAGVELEDGSTIEAPLVVSNADPARTLLDLVGRDVLPPDAVRAAEAIDFRSPSLKINLALDALPQFRVTGASPPGVTGPEHQGTIHLGAQDLDGLEASFAAACAGRLPERPMIELTVPSALDATLAPPGKHVASLFVQHVPWTPQEGGWDRARDAFADRVLALVDEAAPGFSSSVLAQEVLAPPDLERIFGLTGGHLFHGAMTPDRLLFLRPWPGARGYETPIPGLWLCGAGTHPGGGVMGACGRNAAREILRAGGVTRSRALRS
jgi:phytoene dehydrogenase-like protein